MKPTHPTPKKAAKPRPITIAFLAVQSDAPFLESALCAGGPLDGMHFVRAPWNPVRIRYADGFYHITETREPCGCTRWEWHDETTPPLPALLPALP